MRRRTNGQAQQDDASSWVTKLYARGEKWGAMLAERKDERVFREGSFRET